LHVSVAFVIAYISGCGGGPTPGLTKQQETIAWPALDAIQAPMISMGIHRTADSGDVAGFKKAATDPKLAELVDNLEKEPIPSKWASPAREQAKKDTVDAYRSLIEMAQGSPSAKDIKAKAAEVGTLRSKLADPDLK